MTQKHSPYPQYRPAVHPHTGAIKFVLGKPHDGKACGNCGKRIPEQNKYCFWCALSGGQRRVR